MLLLPLLSLAHASGYYFLDSNTRAIARGGAFVAGVDDLSAPYYNPAGLVRIDGTTVHLEGWLVDQQVSFTRAAETDCGAPDPADCTFAESTNEAAPMAIPSGGVAMRLGALHPALERAVLSLTLTPPTGPSMEYPNDGAQRYTLTRAQVLQAWAGPTLAVTVTPWLHVGAGLQWSFLSVKEGLTAKVCLAGLACGNDNPATDLPLEVEALDRASWGGNVGVLLTPSERLSIGLGWQPGSRYEAPGSLTATFPEDFALGSFIDADQVGDDAIVLTAALPQTVRAGVEWAPTSAVRAELAGTWTQWSALSDLVISDLSVAIPTSEALRATLGDSLVVDDDVTLPTGYQDSWSARLGGDVRLAPWARASVGAHWETSAVPSATQGVNVVDGDKWGVGAGASLKVGKGVDLDLAVSRTWLPTRTISDSELTQLALVVDPTNPDAGGVTDGKVVGNGTFASRNTFVGLGLTWTAGGRDGAR
ncbi:MAG: hypothetical protein RLZZ299_565 [Pseudomonadota bacterium]|jgi:long-chain fatty acid transport protein